jgi:ribosome-binding ATPase YchF (GTP1/OBG family)
LEAEVRARGAEGLALSAEVEAEIAELDPTEQPAFLESIGLREPARDRFIRAAYHLLELISFFTVGEDEVRAWTLHRGDKAPRAAGKIHSDLERGFIRVEVVHYDDFMSVGGDAKARERGRMRLEGKEYVVRDGDILNFRAAV